MVGYRNVEGVAPRRQGAVTLRRVWASTLHNAKLELHLGSSLKLSHRLESLPGKFKIISKHILFGVVILNSLLFQHNFNIRIQVTR